MIKLYEKPPLLLGVDILDAYCIISFYYSFK